MQLNALTLKDAFEIQYKVFPDNRGYFTTTFDQGYFMNAGIEFIPVQSNLSQNIYTGTLRGLHFQKGAYEQAKLVRCIEGKIIDVLVDIRPTSPTYGQWTSIELSAENQNAVFIPKGFAHGFQTLLPNSRVFYLMDNLYAPEHCAGYRYDDPAFNITWPIPVTEVSEKDLIWPGFQLLTSSK